MSDQVTEVESLNIMITVLILAETFRGLENLDSEFNNNCLMPILFN